MELNRSIDECIQRIILTDSNVIARIVLCSALANDDVACDTLLATEDLNAKSLSG